MHLSNALAPIA